MINNNHENILVLNNVKELDAQQKTIYTKKIWEPSSNCFRKENITEKRMK